MPQQASESFNPKQPPAASFGEWLRRQRKLRDLTQEDLAQQVGCARVTIRKFESDETRPSKQLAELLAQALEIPADERAAFVQFARGGPAVAEHHATPIINAHPTNNLPVQPTSFIGRERELAEASRLLATTHLLTLTGSGGTGKTRLSLQIAAEVLDAYADGVWFVELAPLTDPAFVVTSIASVLGVSHEQDRPVLATLLDWLRDKQLVLILDNCEHLLDACAHFADAVLHASRESRILASSREALGIAGETAYRVPSLQAPTPAQANQIPLAELVQYEAVRLFSERAAQAQASFQLTSTNAPAVARICYQLDGIPLGIEHLAAARVRAMRVEQIAERLDDRFRLLTGGSRTALPRQQTLRGMIDWSHSLLTEPERVLLRRLSVFAGGWTLAAAEAVCGDDRGRGTVDGRRTTEDGGPTTEVSGGQTANETQQLPSDDVLDLLTRLVDKSLVVLDEQSAEPRYRMLETIRQYAREKLLDAGESERLRDQHLTYYLKLTERTEPMLSTLQRLEWLPRLEADYENLRGALEWACAHDPTVARWFAGVLGRFWFASDYLSEGTAWYRRVFGLSAGAAKDKSTALALFGAGRISVVQFALDDGLRFLKRSVALWRVLDDRARLADSLFWLAYTMVQLGQAEDACALFLANESIIRKFTDPLTLVWALSFWGRALATARADYAGGKVLLDESLANAKRLEDPLALALVSANLGHWALRQGNYEAAKSYFLEELVWRRLIGARWGIGTALGHAADAARCQGDYPQASTFYVEALAAFRAVGFQLLAAYALNGLGYLALRQGNPAQAEAFFAESLGLYRERSDPYGIAICLAGYAELRRVQERVSQAVRLLARAALDPTIRGGFSLAGPIEHERSVTAARAALSSTTFDAAWSEGSAMTLEQAIAEAQREPPNASSKPAAALPADNPAGLSAREVEVLQLLAAGLTNPQIAERLTLSTYTVQAHLRSIYGKLGVTSRSAATRFALNHHLV